MNLAQLFSSRKAVAGSTRDMAVRAQAAGYKISHTQLGEYARGKVTFPAEHTREAIAAALMVDVAEVTLAAVESVAPGVLGSVASQHAQAFLLKVKGRTDDEIRQTLGVVEATLRAMEASRSAVESSGGGPEVPDGS